MKKLDNEPFLIDWTLNNLQKLNKRINRKSNKLDSNINPTKIAILSGGLTAYVCEVLNLFFLEQKINALIYEAPFGTIFTQILDLKSDYHLFNPDITILIPTIDTIQNYQNNVIDLTAIEDSLKSEITIWNKIWNHCKGNIIQFTILARELGVLGQSDRLLPGGFAYYIEQLNNKIIKNSSQSVYFIDTAYLEFNLCPESFIDERLNSLIKQFFSMEAIPSICKSIADAVNALKGKSKKAIIIDLDNTIWGGVIGDDGIDGIHLSHENEDGKSFINFQKYLKLLSNRGIPISICSKNNYETAIEVFRKHPNMILKESDIACFMINFNNKADNIRSIANYLNLGIDSFVFVDDSIVECELVKKELPQVTVVNFPEESIDFVKKIERLNFFPILRLTKEDLSRSNSYKKISSLKKELSNTSDIDGFLKSLKPKALVKKLSQENINRVYQLIGKTNQFKLNKQTYTIEELINKKYNVIALNFEDRLQDYGIISALILLNKKNTLYVENWAMSCRVFNRRLEIFMMQHLLNSYKDQNIKKIELNYCDNNRNKMVLDFLIDLGFEYDNATKTYSALIHRIKINNNHFIDV